jgi:Holliday junction resolvase RusA-like endonuclease
MITITIPGEPVAQGRPRTTRTGHVYDPKKSRDFKTRVWLAAKEKQPETLLEGPLKVEIDIYKSIPVSWSKNKKAAAMAGIKRPTGKPDVDNYVKSCCDGMNGVIWVDDSQIVELLVRKWYSDKPQAVIDIAQMVIG